MFKNSLHSKGCLVSLLNCKKYCIQTGFPNTSPSAIDQKTVSPKLMPLSCLLKHSPIYCFLFDNAMNESFLVSAY